ncbi:hypothetical protein [Sulfobacillus harzensis]|uniref:Uncharacterized protein n=1 Tax=Sulfobacillus harzensis TaxID=2729629 RepID=A0A7Y0L4E8_9FIRM|nr:hypothetical protein [Sulfobacillus harzensis]NMP22200.1 hypothetical protein [Sulfobacillus harzensis]
MSHIHACALAAVQTFPNVTVHTPQGPVNLRVLMVAIAGNESSWVATAAGDALGTCSTCIYPDCRGYTSYGYWQVHFYAWQSYLTQVTGSTKPCDWASWLAIPLNSAKAALHIYQTQGLSAWNADIQGGAWLRYKAQAEAAVKAVSGGQGASASTPPATTAPASGGSGTSSGSPAPSSGPSATVLLVAGAAAVAALVWGASTLL